MQQEEKKQVYGLWIIRHADEAICVLTTDKYDESYERWKTLTDIWVNAIKDKVPFILTAPVVTAFDPGAIKEITIRPVIKVTDSKYDNPYQQQMMKNGLGNTLKNVGNFINPDLLDEGYSS